MADAYCIAKNKKASKSHDLLAFFILISVGVTSKLKQPILFRSLFIQDPSAPAKTEIDHKRINANRKYISTGLKMLKGDIPAGKSEKIKAQILVRYKELISSAEDVTADTIEQIKKAGINI